MPSLVLEATWAAAGGTVIIYLAALLGVPPELYDAAEVDGASIWRKIWHVTLPQLRGVLLITLILQIIGTAQVFLEPFLFTGGGPGQRDHDRAAAHLQVRLPEQPRRRLRRGDGAEPDARRCSWPCSPRSTSGSPGPGARDDHRRERRPSRTPSARGPGSRLGTPTGGAGRASAGPARAIQGGHPAVPARRRARAAPVAGQVRRHADPGHAAARRWRCGRTASTWTTSRRPGTDPHRPLLRQHGRASRSGRGSSRSSSRRPAGYALSVLRPRYAPAHHGPRAGDPVRARRRAAGAAVPDHPGHADRALADQHLLGGLAAGRRERVQRRPRQALLRQPAARDLRGGPHRRRRAVPAVLVDRAADVAADPRRGLGVRGHRDLEGLPLAAAGAAGTRTCSRCRCACRRSSRRPSSDIFLAALAISTLIPIVLFLVFQRMFLRGAGPGRARSRADRAVDTARPRPREWADGRRDRPTVDRDRRRARSHGARHDRARRSPASC